MKRRRFVKLFSGPGRELHVPTKIIYYGLDDCPICKQNLREGRERFDSGNGYEGPHFEIMKITIPSGYWYVVRGERTRILRRATEAELKDTSDD